MQTASTNPEEYKKQQENKKIKQQELLKIDREEAKKIQQAE